MSRLWSLASPNQPSCKFGVGSFGGPIDDGTWWIGCIDTSLRYLRTDSCDTMRAFLFALLAFWKLISHENMPFLSLCIYNSLNDCI